MLANIIESLETGGSGDLLVQPKIRDYEQCTVVDSSCWDSLIENVS
jgi:hypothetical protein